MRESRKSLNHIIKQNKKTKNLQKKLRILHENHKNH